MIVSRMFDVVSVLLRLGDETDDACRTYLAVVAVSPLEDGGLETEEICKDEVLVMLVDDGDLSDDLPSMVMDMMIEYKRGMN